MLSLRAHLSITGGLFAAMIALAVVGTALHDRGVLADGSGMQIAARILFFGLTLALGFSAIPVMVKLVLGGLSKANPADPAAIAGRRSAEAAVIWALWGLCALGLAVALPAAIAAGIFKPSGVAAISNADVRP